MKIETTSFQEAIKRKNIFIPLFQKEPLLKEEIFSYLPQDLQKILNQFAIREFRGEDGEIKSVWIGKGKTERIILLGLGGKNKWNIRKNIFIPRRIVQFAKSEKITELAISLRNELMENQKNSAKIFTENALMAHFDFNQYKEKPKNGWPKIKNIFIAAEKKDFIQLQKGIKAGMISGEETNNCRILANTPGGDMTPEKLAKEAVETAKRAKIHVKVLEEKEMKNLGMGGILGVSRGSDQKPRFIILEYKNGPKKQKPLVLVGKGITFDTGGLNLKPSNSIYEMHMDMSGGAAVIHGVVAVARLKLPINVIGLVPAAENMPSGSSYHPGDLLKSLSGKTIEVLNTDAEGRIILADALYYGTKYKPGLMVDFATLTGAARVALGNYCSALFTNQEKIQNKLIQIGSLSGDYVWPLPLWDEYLPEIKGTFGDLANTGREDRYGGAIHGAKFLEQFVKETPWAHIDIAPRMTAVESDCLAKGALGTGVRFIIELAKQYPRIME